MPTWVDYWNNIEPDHLLAPAEAALVARRYVSLERDTPLRTVFDFGCGPGHVAALIAEAVPRVIAWDAAPNMRTAARDRGGVTVVDDWSNEVPGESVDEVLINSVAQYLDANGLREVLTGLRSVLAPTGSIVLADVVPPEGSLVADLADLMSFAISERFPLRALRGATIESVRRLRSYRSLDLFRLTFDELSRLAAGLEFDTERIEPNLTHFSNRYTARLTPR